MHEYGNELHSLKNKISKTKKKMKIAEV